MTIAIDKESGEVLGQVCDERLATPGHALPDRSLIFILTAAGYRRVSRESVRLETIR